MSIEAHARPPEDRRHRIHVHIGRFTRPGRDWTRRLRHRQQNDPQKVRQRDRRQTYTVHCGRERTEATADGLGCCYEE